jgi:hypothetical protein
MRLGPSPRVLLAAVVALALAVRPAGGGERAADARASNGGLVGLPTANARALETWSYALALDAATWGSPAVIMHALRSNDALGPRPKASPNALWRMANVSTPELSEQAGYVTPNVNTVYGFGFLDLGPEPVVMTLPDSRGRYYMVEVVDMWTNAFAYPAGVDGGYGGGTFAMVGPGWKGDLPDGMRRINAPTRWVLIQPRVHLKNQADLPGARAVLEGITVRGLGEYLGRPASPPQAYAYVSPALKDPRQPVSAMDFADPLQFWEILSEVMNENPPPADQASALVPMYRPLGLELGRKWDRTKVHPIVLRSMRRAAEEVGPMLNTSPRAGSRPAGSCRRRRWGTSARITACGPLPPGSA